MDFSPSPLHPPSRPTVVLVHKRTLYEWHMEQAQNEHMHALLSAHDISVRNIKAAHDRHQRALALAVDAWAAHPSVRLEVIGREALPPPLCADLVVAIGGDGTILEVSHAITHSPLLGMNSDPETSVGYLCAGAADHMHLFVSRYLDAALLKRPLQRLHVSINHLPAGPPIRNDILFTHTCPAATSRYILCADDVEESQKSSGLWISTAAGSTAAIRSAGGHMMDLSDTRIQFRVREPYTKPGERYRCTEGWVLQHQELKLISRMQQAAVYFDGPHLSSPITLGDRISITTAPHPLWQVFDSQP